jgi:hypothetical protein
MTNEASLTDDEIIAIRKRHGFAIGNPWADTLQFARAVESAVRAALPAAQPDFTQDAREWGNALHEAGWELQQAYTRHIGEHPSGRFFNAGKSILRDAILCYANAVKLAAPVAAQPVTDGVEPCAERYRSCWSTSGYVILDSEGRQMDQDEVVKLLNTSGVASSEHGCAAHGLAHPCEACAVESSVEQVLGDFERKERGIPQAHIAADLVRELRAALASGVALPQGSSISDEELSRRYTKASGGPNPFYRCVCGASVPGVRNELEDHARTCGVEVPHG